MLENANTLETLASKVVWSEGMYIGPHQFQLQSRYFTDLIRFAASSLYFAPYGFVDLELDSEALKNDAVHLLRARGLFSDGLPFNVPESDRPPQRRLVSELFPPTRDAVTVLLAVAPHKDRGLNCRLDDILPAECRNTRYVAETRVVHDENTGLDQIPIQMARKNLQLMLDTEPSDGLLTLPVARILRDGAGRVSYDPNFVPPVLQMQASERLMQLTHRLAGILDEKAAVIARRSSGSSDFSSREIANFWLLHTVNSASAALRHLVSAKGGHPEELFAELSRLAGALCTFKLGSHPRALPLYDHHSLSECFEVLDRHIREHLEITVPTNCISIHLKPAGDYFYEGEISDERCLGRSRWLFAVHSAVAEADLMAKTPQLVKICSPQFVRELVKRAMPGLILKHLPVPPAAISPGLEKQYFGISRLGPCWEHIVQTKRIGVYIPGDIPDPEVEVLVVLDR